jgi:uncharacterized protein (TIGR02001 family)
MSMLKKLPVAIAVASSVAFSSMAVSETVESPIGKLDVSMTATLASDWLNRGSSLNGGNPTVQGSLDVVHESGFYAGIWGGSMAGDEQTGGSEFDYYVGYGGSITEDISYDLAVATYIYSGTTWGGEDAESDIEYLGSISAYGGTVGLKYRTEDVKQLYTYLGYSYALPGAVTLSASVGFTDIDDEVNNGEDYTDWSVSLGKSIASLDFALTYATNDLDGTDDNFAVSVSKSF